MRLQIEIHIVVCSLLTLFTNADDRSKTGFDFDTDGLLDSLKDLLNDGGGKGCAYKCPNGAKPVPSKNHAPSTNGCGSFGLQIDTSSVPALEQCCDQHDICYDTCNKDKKKCDDKFRHCLEGICKEIKHIVSKDIYDGCKSAADVMYTATLGLGCKAYRDSQRKACLCPPAGRTEL